MAAVVASNRLLTAAMFASVFVLGVPVTFNNLAPRLDTNGNIMDAHDGSIQKFTPGGPYYLHAVSYGSCKEPANYGCDQTADKCGFQLTHNISIWKSNTMASGSWEYLGLAISAADRPSGVVFRPDLAFSKATGMYVLWWNWVAANGTYMGYAAATSSSPEGPFTLQRDVVNVTRNNDTWHAGDFHFFIDDDVAATPYVIFSSNHWMAIEQLTPDLLASTGVSTPLFEDYFVEAPIMFKRYNGSTPVYYAMFGHCCCFCYQGSGAIVYTAPHPLGPWTRQAGGINNDGDVACVVSGAALGNDPVTALGVNAEPTPGQGCLYNAANQVSPLRSQQNYLVKADTPTGVQLIWTGDRWQQSPDGIKAHDPQLWMPLNFNPDGSVAQMTWVNNFTINIV